MVTQIYWRESVRGASTEQDWLSQHQSWYTWAGWGRGREERGRPTCLVGQEPVFYVTPEAETLPQPHVTQQTMDGLDYAMSPSKVTKQQYHSPAGTRPPTHLWEPGSITRPALWLPTPSPPSALLGLHGMSSPLPNSRAGLPEAALQPGEEIEGSGELILHQPPPKGPLARIWMLARPQQGQEASPVMAISPGL